MQPKTSKGSKFRSQLGTLRQLFVFLWERKQWWLLPVVIVLALFGALLILAQGSVLGPFIYTLF